jgi:hypothetical protein
VILNVLTSILYSNRLERFLWSQRALLGVVGVVSVLSENSCRSLGCSDLRRAESCSETRIHAMYAIRLTASRFWVKRPERRISAPRSYAIMDR